MMDETERQWLEGEDARTQEELREEREIKDRLAELERRRAELASKEGLDPYERLKEKSEGPHLHFEAREGLDPFTDPAAEREKRGMDPKVKAREWETTEPTYRHENSEDEDGEWSEDPGTGFVEAIGPEPVHSTLDEALGNLHEAIEGISEKAAQEATIAAVAAAEFKRLREYQLIQITLLMRLYDVEMARLSLADEELANTVWDAHDRGELMHPHLFVPDLGSAEPES